MPITPTLDYGRRTGVTSLKRIVKALCEIYDVFKPKIDLWVDNNIADPQRAVVKTFLLSLSTVCDIIGQTPDD